MLLSFACVSFFLYNGTDSKPTIAQLTMLKNTKGEKVEIIKTIAPDWMEVGILMDLDPTGKKLQLLKQSMHTKEMD